MYLDESKENGGNQPFVVGEENQASTFSLLTKNYHTLESDELRTPGSAKALLWWLHSFREECERLSMIID